MKRNPSWLRANPMMDRPVRRWERNSMMYLSAMLHHRRVVNRLHRIRDLGFGENRILAVSSDNVCFMTVSSLPDRKLCE